MTEHIAFLGTGLMGYPMAERLLKAGYRLNIYNRTFSKAEPLAPLGAQVVGLPREAIQDADVVILMLADASAIREVLFPDNPISLAKKTVIQMGTIGPAESQEFHQKVTDLGGDYLECPVLGSKNEARQGTLILMVGGSPKQFIRWKNLLSCLGPQPRYIGMVGQAAALKLALNQLIAAHATAFSLSLGMVQSHHIPVDTFMEILRNSFLFAPMFDRKLSWFLKREFVNPNFPLKHLLKDVDLFLTEADQNGLATQALEGIRQCLLRALENGLGDKDYSSVYEVIFPNPHD